METTFWVKWIVALVGIVTFAIMFRARARSEHEREMDELVKKEPK